jgi:signal transduction histidine kinase
MDISDSASLNEAINACIIQINADPETALDNLYQLEKKVKSYPFSKDEEREWLLALHRGLMLASKRLEHFDDAIRFGELAVKNAEKLNNYQEAQSLRVQLGQLHYESGDKLKSMNYYYHSLNNWDGTLPEHLEPIVYLGIAKIHFDQNNFRDAEKSLNSALDKKPEDELRAEILQCLGLVRFEQENYLQALENFSKSLAINEKNQQLNKLCANYYHIGNVFLNLRRNTKADDFFRLAIQYDSLYSDGNIMAHAYAKLMELKIGEGEPENAIQFGERALFLLDEDHSQLDLLESIYLGLSEVYQRKNQNGKALENYRKYNEVLMARFNQNQSEEINEFRVKYEMEKKERELQELNNQKRLSELAYQQRIADDKKEKNMLFTFGVLMFVIILLGAVLLFNFQRQMESNKTIAQKTEEINRVKIKELEKSLRLESANAMLKGQEIERNRIAKDLHDSVGALLSSIKLHFETISGHIEKGKGRQIYEKTNQLIDEACFEVRNISHDMMPGSLIRFGLIPALQDYTSKLKSGKKLSVDIVDYGIPEQLDDSVSLNAYRIVQELLSNVIKHSGAREVMVQLTAKDNQLNIMVEDDGNGFDLEKAKENGIGIKNIISRVNYLNGQIHFDSEKGKGTNIMIDFPLAS